VSTQRSTAASSAALGTCATLGRVLCGNGECTRLWIWYSIVGRFTLNQNFDFQFFYCLFNQYLFVVDNESLQPPPMIALSVFIPQIPSYANSESMVL